MKNQQILITGGSGYIGKIADRILRNRGYKTVVVDIQPFPQHPHFILGDIRNKSVFDNIFSNYKISTVLHLAGKIAARESLQKSSLYFQSNYQGTHNLLTSMKQYGVSQLIFASTAAVYKPNILLTEHDLLFPNTPYGWSKLYCEQAIQRSNISAYILRLFNVGGALNTLLLGENHDPETHFIPLAIDANIHQKNLILYGKSKEVFAGCTRDYIHVADVVNAFLRCLDRPLRNNHREILNICSNKGYRVEEIVTMTESLTGKKTKTILRQLPKNESYILVGNNTKARQVLGWSPTNSIEDLIQSAWTYQTQQNSEITTI